MIYKFKKWVILPAFTEVIISAENDQEALRIMNAIDPKTLNWQEAESVDQRMTYEVIDIPEDLKDIVDEWRQNLVESVAEYDDNLLEKFFEDPDSITKEEMMSAIRKAVIDMSFSPVMCGSAFKNKGVQALLDAVCAYLPSPLDLPPISGTNPDNDQEVTRNPNNGEPFAALAFKIATDPFVGRLCFFRVYSGKLNAGSYIFNNRITKLPRYNFYNCIIKKTNR